MAKSSDSEALALLRLCRRAGIPAETLLKAARRLVREERASVRDEAATDDIRELVEATFELRDERAGRAQTGARAPAGHTSERDFDHERTPTREQAPTREFARELTPARELVAARGFASARDFAAADDLVSALDVAASAGFVSAADIASAPDRPAPPDFAPPPVALARVRMGALAALLTGLVLAPFLLLLGHSSRLPDTAAAAMAPASLVVASGSAVASRAARNSLAKPLTSTRPSRLRAHRVHPPGESGEKKVATAKPFNPFW